MLPGASWHVAQVTEYRGGDRHCQAADHSSILRNQARFDTSTRAVVASQAKHMSTILPSTHAALPPNFLPLERECS